MDFKLENVSCLICGEKAQKPFLSEVKDRFNLEQGFQLVSCKSCDFTYLSPRLNEHKISTIYNYSEYQPHTLSNSLSDRLYKIIRTINLKNKNRLISKLTIPGSLLDIGSGTGEFLQEMKESGWDVSGMEVVEEAQKQIQKKGLTVYSDLNQIDVQFNVITLWHVLEHIHRVQDLFSDIYRLLSDDGYLIIAVPNIESFDAQFYKDSWAALDAPRHLYHFRVKDLDLLLRQNKFKLKRVSPLLYFDPWYNALLSEQINSKIRQRPLGVGALLRAITIGKISFLLSVLNRKKSASPVYIAVKIEG
jgi:SAM-dependent methyltransferase